MDFASLNLRFRVWWLGALEVFNALLIVLKLAANISAMTAELVSLS